MSNVINKIFYFANFQGLHLCSKFLSFEISWHCGWPGPDKARQIGDHDQDFQTRPSSAQIRRGQNDTGTG